MNKILEYFSLSFAFEQKLKTFRFSRKQQKKKNENSEAPKNLH